MPRSETHAPTDCVPVSASVTHGPAGEIVPLWEDPTRSAEPWPVEIGPQPATASPYEWVASEGTLLRMLQRQYGWVVTEPGVLRRYRRA